jgi:outer membrane protein assembly factor BamE (lipoprotein component of BamABCDE complex)
MRSIFKAFSLLLAGICCFGAAGCLTKRNEMGVENKWRAEPQPSFEKGKSTQTDVMRSLGPPSQVIALHEQTLFYYLREQSRTSAMFFIVYNQMREQIVYDRAIFFFNQQGVLTDFAYSEEAVAK